MINFRLVPWNGVDKDYIDIIRSTESCSSYIGKTGGRQEIKLTSYCASTVGIVIHELMHAIGAKEKFCFHYRYIILNFHVFVY